MAWMSRGISKSGGNAIQDDIPVDPCFLRHGEPCKARMRCKSSPKFEEVCFKPMDDVSMFLTALQATQLIIPVRVRVPG